MQLMADVLNLLFERRLFFIELLFQHIYLSAIAILITTIVGVTAGIIMTRHNKLASFLMLTTNFIYTIPSIALFGFLVAITGIGSSSALIALVIYGLLPIIRNTYAGIRSVDSEVVESAVAMGSTDYQLLVKVQLPMAMPIVMAGFRTMVVMTIALGGIASFIGAGGLGVAIWRGITTNFPQMTVAGSLLVALLALTADLAIGGLEKLINKKCRKGGKKMKTKSIALILFVMLMVAVGCTKTEKKITVASKPHTEQYILAEIISQLIENKTDIKVERKLGIGGGTSNIHPAMLKGDIDIYPEYTGTAWLFVLKEEPGKTKEPMYDALKKAYSEKFHIKWLGRYGFNNTYTLALPEKTAVDHNINTFSDLAGVSSEYIFGAEYDFFERDDGYNGLAKTYGFNFKDTKEMDIGLKYVAIASKKVDVINAFSTDGLLLKEKLKVLKDDRNYFPAYEAATLIREEALKKYPELDKLLGQLTGKISDEKMIKMNYAVEIEKKDPSLVAKEFLREEGMIK